VASIAITMPTHYEDISSSIGNFAIGVMIATLIALLYSIVVLKKVSDAPTVVVVRKNRYVNITESVIFSVMVAIALLVGIMLELENPYWVPTSCMAVMQGVSTKHIWTRAMQRVLGTFIGLGLTWLILQFDVTILGICISILLLQTTVEFLIVRNYAIAAMFITTLTILLAEPNISLLETPDNLMITRFFDILIGSAIGAIGGWFLYNEKIHYFTKKQVRKTKVAFRKYKS